MFSPKLFISAYLWNWVMAIIGAFILLNVYTTIGSWLALYNTFLIQLFPEVVDKQSKLYLLYLGILVRSLVVALLSAFTTSFALGLLFGKNHFWFGIITGILGFVSFHIIINPASPPIDKVYEILSFVEWGLLIIFSGVAAHLGQWTKWYFKKQHASSV